MYSFDTTWPVLVPNQGGVGTSTGLAASGGAPGQARPPRTSAGEEGAGSGGDVVGAEEDLGLERRRVRQGGHIR